MEGLLVVTNEKADAIAMHEFGELSNSPLPMLLAYASLDLGDAESYAGYTVHTHSCIAGHRILLVLNKKSDRIGNLLRILEHELNQNVMSPFSDDSRWLSREFHDRLRTICDEFLHLS